MKLTFLLLVTACLMGAMLALTLGPQKTPDEGPELVSEQPAVIDE
ncbi:MAG: hypothetical protein ACRDHF_14950 [Tepidiformaceae bacterium]